MSEARTLRLFHPTRADRVVRVTAQSEGAHTFLCVARGADAHPSTVTERIGPFLAGELERAWLAVERRLRAEGYESSGVGAALRELASREPARRAHAARRLARARTARAAEPLLALARTPGPELPAVLDALATLHDERAAPLAADEARKKLLFRRRAGEEALRALSEDGRGALASEARARLPEGVRRAIAQGAPSYAAGGLDELPAAERAAALEDLYLIDEAGAREVLRAALVRTDIAAPGVWRHVKSIWKRALARGDADMVGLITCEAERRAWSHHGTTATVRTGVDAAVKTVRVFSRKTVDYMRRRAWRFLRELAAAAPEEYPRAASAMLAAYAPDPARDDPAARVEERFVLHNVLRGRSRRHRLDARTLRFRLNSRAAEGLREEAYPELWDAQPTSFVHLLGRARVPAAVAFALAALRARHPRAIEEADTEDVVRLLDAEDPRVVDLGLAELRRRFRADEVPLEVVRAACCARSVSARAHGHRALAEAAPRWMLRAADALPFLGLTEPHARELAVRLCAAALPSRDEAERRAWTHALLAHVDAACDAGAADAGALRAVVEVLVRALDAELLEHCPLPRAVRWIERGPEAVRTLGAHVLAKKPGALDVLGVSVVLRLASHDQLVVRRAAHALLHLPAEDIARDPAPACALIGSSWSDSRAAGQALLERLDPDAIQADAWLLIADTPAEGAYDLALSLLARRTMPFAAPELAARIAQHPSTRVREAVLARAAADARPGVVGLLQLEPLVRRALHDPAASAFERRGAFDVMERRGLDDEHQAEVVASIAHDVLRGGRVRETERALALLTRIRLTYPRVASPVLLVEARA